MAFMTTSAAKFTLVLPAVKPGDFGPEAFSVWTDDYYAPVEYVRDGDVVEALEDVRVETEGSYDDMYEQGYRKVRLASGFVGTVCWTDFDGRMGFKAA